MTNRRENAFKKYLVKIMGTRWDVQSHEDKYSTGIPDISFGAGGINGWIELKQIPAWSPSGAAVKPGEYTPEQVNWLNRRGKKGGHCFVFVKVGKDEYFLFRHHNARDVAHGMAKGNYYTSCLKYWIKSINPDDLIKILVAEQNVNL